MTTKNKKQFGIWMDSHTAFVVGREHVETGDFKLLFEAKNAGKEANSNEHGANNSEITLVHKFFKEICAHMQNAEELHVTGTGTIQEQFINYLAETPQFKNTATSESTSLKMSDEKLLHFFAERFN